jgi:hypothetical protein
MLTKQPRFVNLLVGAHAEDQTHRAHAQEQSNNNLDVSTSLSGQMQNNKHKQPHCINLVVKAHAEEQS